MGHMEPIFLGIDPGLTGGLAWLQRGELVYTCPMPVDDKFLDLRALYIKLTRYNVDHAFLEKKAANNAMELLTRWPGDWTPGWVETMTSVARDEAAHLAQAVKLLAKRGGRLQRIHKNPYANSLRLLVRKGGTGELLDRLFVSALIELQIGRAHV